MTIHDEYLCYQEKYERKYGKDKTVVMMQVGSFHEAYSTDTRGANLLDLSEVLGVARTKKDKKVAKVDEKNPYMLGFPSVAFKKYIKIMIDAGYTVIVIDQVTPPPNPRREVTGVYSIGTYIEEPASVDAQNIVCLYIVDEKQHSGTDLTCVGMSVVDLTTGETAVHEAHSTINDDKFALDEALRFIVSYRPKEILVYTDNNKNSNKNKDKDKIIQYLEIENKNFKFFNKIDKSFKKISYINQFLKKVYPNTGSTCNLTTVEELDLERKLYCTTSLVALLVYAYQHNDKIIDSLHRPEIFNSGKHLILGNNALYQLNVFESDSTDSFNKQFKSLFDVVNNTSTAQGRRCLKAVLSSPITSVVELEKRYDLVENFMKNGFYLKIEEQLREIVDLERFSRRICLGTVHPFEFANIYNSLKACSTMFNMCKKVGVVSTIIPDNKVLNLIKTFIKEVEDTFILEEMSKYSRLDIECSIFKEGVYKDVDRLQDEINTGITFMENICKVLSKFINDNSSTVKPVTKSDDQLKIQLKRNAVDGYYLSLTKKRADSLKKSLEDVDVIQITDKISIDPSKLQYKHLKGTTKIFIEDLAKKSENVVVLKEKLTNSLFGYYTESLAKIHKKYDRMLYHVYRSVAQIDFLKSAAKTAKMYNYCRPVVEDKESGYVNCTGLRHPIVERICESEYKPHDISLGVNKDNNVNGVLIYGLNSSGKSTVMKAVGTSVIMAQSGMFVAASSFSYSPYSSMFARITGNDNIFKGMSSFVLEMTELKAILQRTGVKTLVIGDEVCRGTEHISGNAIVAATILNLAKSGSCFIFATHLHEIADMERIKALDTVKTYHLTVTHDEKNGCLIFDRKLKPGSGDRVYGYTVAKYIINDPEFISVVQEIKNELTDDSNVILDTKTSKYNSKLYVHSCAVCKCNSASTTYDTHHINFQKDCKDGFVKEKPHMLMNSKSNLVVLCKSCHVKVHQNLILIKGYKDSSKGLLLDFEIKQNKTKSKLNPSPV